METNNSDKKSYRYKISHICPESPGRRDPDEPVPGGPDRLSGVAAATLPQLPAVPQSQEQIRPSPLLYPLPQGQKCCIILLL